MSKSVPSRRPIGLRAVREIQSTTPMEYFTIRTIMALITAVVAGDTLHTFHGALLRVVYEAVRENEPFAPASFPDEEVLPV